MLNVIADGWVDRYEKGNKTVVLSDGEYEAVLALTRFGNKETWLFNGWRKDEKTGADGKVSTHSDATQANPTFSREDLGAVLSEAKIQQHLESANNSYKNYQEIAKEIDNIKTKSQDDGTFMTSPNGRDSNLSEDDWLKARTKQFKKKFGDWETPTQYTANNVDDPADLERRYPSTLPNKPCQYEETYEICLSPQPKRQGGKDNKHNRK